MKEGEFKAMVMPGCRAAYAWACRIVGAEDASDIMQECLRRLWERKSELRTMGNLGAYTMMIARNLTVDIIRERQQTVALSASLSDVVPDSDSESAPAVEESLLRRMLAGLPDIQRQVVRLSLIAEMSNTEIAAATGLSSDAVRQNLSRGRKKLRELYIAATK